MTKSELSAVLEERHRMWASASFVAVLIVVGMPLWWKTTEVYRVSLPYERISRMDPLSHGVSADLTVLAPDRDAADKLGQFIEESFKNTDVIKLRIRKEILTEELRGALDSVTDEREAVKEVAKKFDIMKHNTFYVVQRTSLAQDVWLGSERVMFYRNGEAGRAVVDALQRWVYRPATLEGARSDTPDSARRSRFPAGGSYHVVLSVVHPHPDRIHLNFPAADALEDYVGSFADELRELHNFTLKSQWLHMLNFDFQPKEVRVESGQRYFAVRRERLSLLLTRLEERAATRVSGADTVNLALYAVPCDLAPLRIHDDYDRAIESPVSAFLSPRWGGVVLASPSAAECARRPPRHEPDVPLVMGAFVSQLRTLLGIQPPDSIAGARLEPLRSVSPRRWEVDGLLRVRTLDQLCSAERTLRSLAQLLGEISNIVINDEVGACISAAVSAADAAAVAAEHGELLVAYRGSLDALAAAETAFTEPSLLALLYFPDDQKYAIYIPLFLPIMFPVVLSLKNLALWLRGGKEKVD